jgi:dihydrofolate synthase/folylpolyglutamate synthase
VSPDPILARLEALGMRLGLEPTRDLLARLGAPQLRVPVVLVAGSNGKGSTSAFLAAMATAAGYRTGHYTSPHLERVEERLQIDGRPIEPERLGHLLAEIVDAAERASGAPPTYFEALTVAAFRWFAEEDVDLAIVEVGLGGRLDATNLAEPILSLVTSISLEHREFLGDTLSAIAREKAGIFRPGRPALAWVEDPEPRAALQEVAAEKGTDLRFAQDLVRIEDAGREGWSGQRVRLVTPGAPGGHHDLWIALLGAHQQRNLGLAVLAAETLAAGDFPKLGPEAIAAGAGACRWPGRLEAIELPAGRRLLLDAAHNAEGAAALAGFLAGLGAPVDLLFGVLTDKDAAVMLGALAPHARRLILTTPPSPRALEPAELLRYLEGREGVEVEPDSARALDRLLEGDGETLVVCGSIYLIGEIRARVMIPG